MKDLLEGLDDRQASVITADPSHYLAIIPFNAGKDFFQAFPNVDKEIRGFLAALKIAEGPVTESIDDARRRLKVLTPLAKKKNSKRVFDKPWTVTLAGFSPEEREYLLYQQTFDVHKTLSFHVIPFEKNFRSWIIMHISGNAVEEGCEDTVIDAIKRVLWKDKPFRDLVDRVFAAKGDGRSTNERVITATSTFSLKYIFLKDARGNDDPVLQLMGMPISDEEDVHSEWLALIRRPAYYIEGGMKRLVIGR
jgi:hypothetical protein